jgi:hypothetical protein
VGSTHDDALCRRDVVRDAVVSGPDSMATRLAPPEKWFHLKIALFKKKWARPL